MPAFSIVEVRAYKLKTKKQHSGKTKNSEVEADALRQQGTQGTWIVEWSSHNEELGNTLSTI